MENSASSKSPHIPNNAPTTQQPSQFAVTAVHALAWARVIAGGMAVVVPSLAARLFQLPGISSTSISAYFIRLFGIRDVVIGELTWVHRPKFASPGSASEESMSEVERKTLRTILFANVATDAMDVVAAATALSSGAIPRNAALFIGGGAVTFLGLGLIGLAKI